MWEEDGEQEVCRASSKPVFRVNEPVSALCLVVWFATLLICRSSVSLDHIPFSMACILH